MLRRCLTVLSVLVVGFTPIPLHAGANPMNHRYLATKAQRMGHIQD